MTKDEEEKEKTEYQKDSPSDNRRKLPKINFRNIKPLHIVTAVLVVAVAVAGVLYLRSQEDLKKLKNPQSSTKREVQDIVKMVGKIVVLPQNEEPTVATVTDPQKLKDQPFFASAQKNDKVLIYTNARKAIIYRPSINKVVDVAPINVNQPQGQVAGEKVQKPRFTILNGTDTSGLARRYQKEVESKITGSQVVSVGDAKKKGVDKTFVVTISGADASQVASTLGIQTGTLPDGEQKPDADFLVILGLDKSSF